MIAALSLAPATAGDTAIAGAQVALVTPLSLIHMADMDFGQIAPLPTAGTVVINPVDNSCATTGGLVQAGTCRAAVFGGMGARRMFVRITTPASVLLTGPGAPMVLDTFTLDTAPDLQHSPNGNGGGLGNLRRYQIISDTGIYSFNVGGTLRVNGNQTPGVYSGTFAVTAVYQ